MKTLKHFENIYIGRKDVNGVKLCNGQHVKVIIKHCVPITDGFGRGDYGSQDFIDEYTGHIYFDIKRSEFRIDDERFGDGKRNRNLYKFDEITVIK